MPQGANKIWHNAVSSWRLNRPVDLIVASPIYVQGYVLRSVHSETPICFFPPFFYDAGSLLVVFALRARILGILQTPSFYAADTRLTIFGTLQTSPFFPLPLSMLLIL